MSLINVDNVLSGLNTFGVDADKIYRDLSTTMQGTDASVLENYLNMDPGIIDLNSEEYNISLK